MVVTTPRRNTMTSSPSISPRTFHALARVVPLLFVLLTGCADKTTEFRPGSVAPPFVPPAAPTTPAQPIGIQPGEVLDVFVMEDESFSGSYTVRSTGDIIVPKLGRVKVQSLSAQAVEKELSRVLEKNTLTKATVLVDRAKLVNKPPESAKPAGTEVFLSGKVSQPGRYTLTPIGGRPPTVHQAILQAGGCSRFAHKRRAHVLRRASDGRLHRIDADLIAIESGAARDVPLMTGDIVMVPEKKVDFGL